MDTWTMFCTSFQPLSLFLAQWALPHFALYSPVWKRGKTCQWNVSQLLLRSRSFSGVCMKWINPTCWKVTRTGVGGLNDLFKWEFKVSASCPSLCSPSVLFAYHFTVGLTRQVQVFLQQWVSVHVSVTVCVFVGESLSPSLTPCLCHSLPAYASVLSLLFLPSAKHTKQSQVQPFSWPNTLLKTPQWSPKPKPGFSCTIVTSKQKMLCSVRTIYISTTRASFSLFLLSRNNLVRLLYVCIRLCVSVCVWVLRE